MLGPMHSHRGPLAQLRRGHEERVLGLLRRHGQLSRAELGRLSGLSRTTLYDIVATLVAGGAVVPGAADPGPRKRGRPVEHLTLDPAAGQALGIDFARRSVHVAAANVAHEMIGSASLAHPPDLPWEGRVDLAEKLVASLAGGALRLSALGATGAVGVGVVGPVRRTETEDLPTARGHRGTRPGGGHGGALADLVELLTHRFGAPVLIDNNTRLAALAEATWGAAAGSPDVLYLRLSHGVGGGLVVNGALHRGVDGLAGELGHITADPAGGPCECGGTGCLETVASVGAVLAAYRERGKKARDFAAFLAALEDGDTVAEDVLRRAGTLVGTVLASVVGALGPSTIVLGGELAQAGEALLGPVAEALDAHVLPLARDRVTLRPAALGEAGGAHGGVALALHESPLLARYPGPALPEDDA
ncbi:ROK family protein [Streptomyces sp. NBC_00247]|uniref:ROK family protein n=1 Tax=Streptomyces sp. NBC_00247 TaxID=2975689 RepID=UPI002E2C8A74|nr:ROK family protein [Streptomyces sp. NBC_00247]